MNRNELMDWINQMEKQYPVDEWKIHGMHVWPYLRVKLSFHLVRQDSQATSEDSAPRSIREKVRRYVKVIKTTVLFFFSTPQADFAFLGAFSHRVKYRSSWFNRFFDPVVEGLAEDGYHCARLEYNPSTQEQQELPLYQEENVLLLKDVMPAFLLWQRLSDKLTRMSPALANYRAFLAEVDQIPELDGATTFLSPANLLRDFSTIAAYRTFFRTYLVRTRPRALLVLCYYSLAVRGAIAAARELGVLSIDMQHGPQTGIHPAYSRFTRVPLRGYNLLPDVFWVWDDSTEESLKEWLDLQTHHRVRQWGHPWVQYWQRMADDAPRAQSRVLYSLQPVGELLETYVVEAMQQSYSDFHWCLRLHPRQQYALKELEERIKDAGLTNKVTIDDGLSSPLPQILAHTTVHLTRFSGAALEAAMLHVPTVFLDPLAQEYFPDLLTSQRAFVLKTFAKEELLATIRIAARQQVDNKATTNLQFQRYSTLLTKDL